MHLLAHLFDDIEAKGVTANFTTKPGEQMHARLRAAFLTSSRKKDTADGEVLRKAHAVAVYQYIQSEIDVFDQSNISDPDDEEDDSNSTEPQIIHVQLCSKSGQLTLSLLEGMHPGDPAFRQFGTRVRQFIPTIDSDFLVTELTHLWVYSYKLLKVQYESYEDWCLHRDLLRCSPLAYGKERYDHVLISNEDGVVPAQLLALFECWNYNKTRSLQMALILYFDPVYHPISAIERATGFRRFRKRSRDRAAIVSIKSIIRGALLVPTGEPSFSNDYFTNDLLDPDMYLRFLSYTEHNQFQV